MVGALLCLGAVAAATVLATWAAARAIDPITLPPAMVREEERLEWEVPA